MPSNFVPLPSFSIYNTNFNNKTQIQQPQQQKNQFQQHHQQQIKKKPIIHNPKCFCQTCERSFADESELQKHIEKHEKCNHPGCNYSASKTLVNAHKIMHDPRYLIF